MTSRLSFVHAHLPRMSQLSLARAAHHARAELVRALVSGETYTARFENISECLPSIKRTQIMNP